MKTTSRITLLRVLHYTFLGLTVSGVVVMVLNLSSYFGLSSERPFIRGWTTTVREPNPIVLPHPDGSGEMKLYDFGQQRLVMLQFDDMDSILQARYLSYILFQNLVWVCGIFILLQMTRIFRNLHRGGTFQVENTRRVRVIAVLVLVFPVLQLIAGRLLAGITYSVEGHRITTAVPPGGMENLIAGGLLALIIFSLGEVFHRGAQLQQEQDLTI